VSALRIASIKFFNGRLLSSSNQDGSEKI